MSLRQHSKPSNGLDPVKYLVVVLLDSSGPVRRLSTAWRASFNVHVPQRLLISLIVIVIVVMMIQCCVQRTAGLVRRRLRAEALVPAGSSHASTSALTPGFLAAGRKGAASVVLHKSLRSRVCRSYTQQHSCACPDKLRACSCS